MRNRLTRIRLLDATVDFGQQYQPLDRILNGRVVRQTLNRLKDLLLGRHVYQITTDCPSHQLCLTGGTPPELPQVK